MIYKKDIELEKKWVKVLYFIKDISGKRPMDLDTVLFLIGVQELGQGAKKFSKEEKQDIIHIAICKILSLSGYYKLEGIDKDGWPHWHSIKSLPHLNLEEQNKILKMHAIEYFETEMSINL